MCYLPTFIDHVMLCNCVVRVVRIRGEEKHFSLCEEGGALPI